MNMTTFPKFIMCAIVSVAVCACAAGTTDPIAEKTALDSATTPVSGEMLDKVRNDNEFLLLQEQVQRDGYFVAFDEGVELNFSEYNGAFFPLVYEASGTASYRGIVFQYKESELPLVALELETVSSSNAANDIDWDAAPNTQPQGYTCSGWGQWYTISTYCENNIMCWGGPATMLVRKRDRSCCATSCWIESQYTTVRNKCGC